MAMYMHAIVCIKDRFSFLTHSHVHQIHQHTQSIPRKITQYTKETPAYIYIYKCNLMNGIQL